jgi:hypothetical protein
MSGDQLPKPDPGDYVTVGGGPQLSIERLMAQLVEQAARFVSPASPATAVDANRTIVSELSLPAVLRQIVEQRARPPGPDTPHSGVIGSDGLLEELIHVGMDDARQSMRSEICRRAGGSSER